MCTLQCVLSVLGRVMLCVIFFMSAAGNKIPQFHAVAGYMESAGVPQPALMLIGAIAFLLAGSLSVILGFMTRIGATMLLVFLILATYYFHPFWKTPDDQQQMIHFMKNLSMAGAMVFLIANGPGKCSLDHSRFMNPGKA